MENLEGTITAYDSTNRAFKVSVKNSKKTFLVKKVTLKGKSLDINDKVLVSTDNEGKVSKIEVAKSKTPPPTKRKPLSTAKRIVNMLGLSRKDVGRSAARKAKKEVISQPLQKLSTNDIPNFDSLWESIAQTIFAEKYDFLDWLTTPNEAINDEVPIKLLTTEVGIERVKKLLGRLEYGIVS